MGVLPLQLTDRPKSFVVQQISTGTTLGTFKNMEALVQEIGASQPPEDIAVFADGTVPVPPEVYASATRGKGRYYWLPTTQTRHNVRTWVTGQLSTHR